MASFFFSEELAYLFDDDFRVVWSPVQLSLERATELYNQKLYPTRNKVTPSASSNTLYSSPVSEQAKHPFHNSIRVSHGSSSTVSEFEPRSASSISLAEGITRKQKSRAIESSFQRRTYYGGMKKCDEHRAPFAAHQNDTACNALLRRVDPPFQQSHAAYRVASDKRGHPSYMAIQGVHSGQGPESIARNFSFQRQTNYPFRKTYMPPVQPATRSVGTVSERRNTSPIASSLSSRVPVFDLSHPLSEVIGSWGGIGGLFFRPDNSEQPEFVDNLEDGGIILSIGNDGKLTSKRS